MKSYLGFAYIIVTVLYIRLCGFNPFILIILRRMLMFHAVFSTGLAWANLNSEYVLLAALWLWIKSHQCRKHLWLNWCKLLVCCSNPYLLCDCDYRKKRRERGRFIEHSHYFPASLTIRCHFESVWRILTMYLSLNSLNKSSHWINISEYFYTLQSCLCSWLKLNGNIYC